MSPTKYERARQRQPFLKCVEEAARRSGYNKHQVRAVVTFFLYALTEEIASNRIVRIRGFGSFYPRTVRPRFSRILPYSRPAFIAAQAFNNEVELRCPADKKYNRWGNRRAASNGGRISARSGPERSARVAKAIERELAENRAEARRLGLSDRPTIEA